MPRRVDKPWGYELIFAETDKYVGKILYIYKGHELSLQYHKIKDETIYLYRGSAELQIAESVHDRIDSVMLTAGESRRIKPLYVHRIIAFEDCEVLEVSTPELNDLVRIKDRYNRT